jgi:ATP-dependent DNA helicase RecQ
VVRDTRHLYKSKEIVFTLIGRVNAKLKHIELILNLFGCGVAFDEKYWMALLRQVLEGICTKISKLMVSKITDKGLSFINKPSSFDV